MKTIGIMCVKDEADLLPQVYPHIRSLVDYIYAYDDGSIDNTWEYIKESDYAIKRINDPNRESCLRGNYHHLLEKIKKDFGNEEDIWCFLTMGDRFFINKYPKEIAENSNGYSSVEGVQLDFLRYKDDPWTEENDPFPDYSNIRKICRWARVDERCIVAFRLNNGVSYLTSNYPWPRGIGMPQYGGPTPIVKEMPYLEHQGRRSPKGFIWRYSNSRPISVKYKDIWDLSSFQKAVETNWKWYSPKNVTYWQGLDTLNNIVKLANEGFYV